MTENGLYVIYVLRSSVAIFASGGGALSPAFRAEVEGQIRLLEDRLGGPSTGA